MCLFESAFICVGFTVLFILCLAFIYFITMFLLAHGIICFTNGSLYFVTTHPSLQKLVIVYVRGQFLLLETRDKFKANIVLDAGLRNESTTQSLISYL